MPPSPEPVDPPAATVGALAALARDPGTAALVLDFDGVLVPIVDDPAGSRLDDAVRADLARLAGRLGLVAVVSGRRLGFLVDQVRIDGVRLLGSYGLEERVDGRNTVLGHVGPWLAALDDARAELSARLADVAGVRIEVKSVSVAAHWRQAADRATARPSVERAVAAVAERTGLVAKPAKLALELLPPVGVDKGSTVRRLLEESEARAAVFVGDDLGDVPALDAVRESGGHAVVVLHGEETPTELLRHATETVDGSHGMRQWLRCVAQVIAS